MSAERGKPYCACCHQSFGIGDSGRERVPHLLKCNHSVCNFCCDQGFLNGRLKCGKCSGVTECQQEQRDSILPKNFYLIGRLHELTKGAGTKAEEKHNPDDTKDCQRCNQLTFTKCDVCKLPFCETCFGESHADKFWMHHELVGVAVDSNIYKRFVRDWFCFVHDEKQTFYCNTCKQQVCLGCSKLHKAHTLRTMPEAFKEQTSVAAAFKKELASIVEESCIALKEFNNFEESCKIVREERRDSIEDTIAEVINTLQHVAAEQKAIVDRETKIQLQKHQSVKEIWSDDLSKFRQAIDCVDQYIENQPLSISLTRLVDSLADWLPALGIAVKVPHMPSDSLSSQLEFSGGDMSKEIRKRVKAKKFTLPQPIIEERRISSQNKESTQLRPVITKPAPVKPAYQMKPAPPVISKVPEKDNDSGSESSRFSYGDDDEPKVIYKTSKLSLNDSTTNSAIIPKNPAAANESTDTIRSVGVSPFESRESTSRYFPSTSYKSKTAFTPKFTREMRPQELIQFAYFEAKVTAFTSFDNFHIRKSDEQAYREQERLDTELLRCYKDHQKQVDKLYVGFFASYFDFGAWRRVEVTTTGDITSLVFFIDTGDYKEVKNSDLMFLDRQFFQTKKIAIKCKLADIKPKEDLGHKYPEKAIKAFKKLAIDSNFTLKVLVLNNPKTSSDSLMRGTLPNPHIPNDVVVYIFPNNGQKVNLNAFLVEKLNCADSTGPDSLMTIQPDEDAIEKHRKSPISKDSNGAIQDKRLPVELVNVVSPSEFYVALKHRQNDYEDSDLLIQNFASHEAYIRKIKEEVVTSTQWKVGDLCLVEHSLPDKESHWYRGSIHAEESVYLIYLLDQGVIIRAEKDSLLEIPEYCPKHPPAAIRMHLSGAVPLAGSKTWNRSSLDMFIKIVSKFEQRYISVVGDKTDGEKESIPALLWGLSKEDNLLGTQKQYHNLFEYLLHEGYIDKTAETNIAQLLANERSISDADFGWKSSSSPHTSEHDSEVSPDIEDVPIDNYFLPTQHLVPKAIASWIPAEACKVGDFEGIPTEVDDSGVIFLQTVDQNKLFKEMTAKLTSIYSKYEPEYSSDDLFVNQPVLCHYQITGEFFRGVIEKIQKSSIYTVRLVDTGAVEHANRKDIFVDVIASDIPVQCHKCKIPSIAPSNLEHVKWPAATLNYLHGALVDHFVNVKVKIAGDINECSFKIGAEDFEQTLIDTGLVRKLEEGEIWPRNDCVEIKAGQDDEYEQIENLKVAIETKKWEDFANPHLKPANINVTPEETKKYLNNFNDDLNIEAMTVKSSSSVGTLKTSSSKNRQMTSTPFETVFGPGAHRKRRFVKPPKIVHFFDLRAADIEEFDCTFANYYESKRRNALINIYVTLDIPELNEALRKMDKWMQTIEDDALIEFSNLVKASEAKKVCLVKTNEGWKRGAVSAVHADQTVEVFLLDSAKHEMFKPADIFKMPAMLFKFPKKVLTVVLDGITLNPNCGHFDMSRILPEKLGKRTLKAIVKNYDEKDYPLVDLVDGNSTLAYQGLIDSSFFVKTP